MKVYIITSEPFPNGMAATNRIKNYSKGLISSGIECEVIIYRRTEKYGIKPKNTIGFCNEGEIPFRYIGGTPLRGANVFFRKYYDLKDKWDTIQFIKRNVIQRDVIITYMGENLYCELLIDSVHQVGAKVIRELCELPYGTCEDNAKIRKKRKKYLKSIFPKFDGFICISQALFDLATNYKSSNSKLIKVPILIDTNESKFQLNKSSEIVPFIFHSGTLYEQKDGILGALEAFGIASKSLAFPIKYILTGSLNDSPDRLEIEKIIKKYLIENSVIFTGYLSENELKTYQNDCAFMIINKQLNQQNKFCFATKLGEYLIAGKPIITTSVGEVTYYLKDGVSACIIEPGNVQLLAEKIIELFNDSVFRDSLGKNGRNVALNKFSYKIQGKILADFLKAL